LNIGQKSRIFHTRRVFNLPDEDDPSKFRHNVWLKNLNYGATRWYTLMMMLGMCDRRTDRRTDWCTEWS